MSRYYNPKKTTNIFNPNSEDGFRISRSKIDLFAECPRCFYFDLRFGVSRPPGYPFSLNNAVDLLLKKEFDIHRAAKTPHPLMKEYGIDAVPFTHEKMNEWRNVLRGGIRYLHKPTNLIITGGVDDVWVNPQGELIIVDYKATAKNGEINLDADWQDSYKRQMEVYQWLFRNNGFKVSDTGYFVYCNGDIDKEALDGKLEFNVKVLPYQGNTGWIEGILSDIKNCLVQNEIPKVGEDCDFCKYRGAVKDSLSKYGG